MDKILRRYLGEFAEKMDQGRWKSLQGAHRFDRLYIHDQYDQFLKSFYEAMPELMLVNGFPLSVRARRHLIRAGVRYVGDLTEYTKTELKNVPLLEHERVKTGAGKKTIEEIREKLLKPFGLDYRASR